MAVCRDLDSIAQSRGHIVNEFDGALGVALSDKPRRDKLCVGVNRYPRPHVAASKLLLLGRSVLFLRSAERPDFIELQALASQVAERRRLIFPTNVANLNQQPHDRLLRHSGNPDSGANGGSFNQAANHRRPRGVVQSVHGRNYA
jgi:hypothetical protein